MKTTSLLAAAFFYVAAGSATGRAQVLTDLYTFDGNLNDSVGSTPLVSYGGSLITNPSNYTFAPTQGLRFDRTGSFTDSFTVGMRFQLSGVSSSGSGYLSLFGRGTPAAVSTDEGHLFINPSGHVEVYTFGASSIAPLTAGPFYDLAIVRDVTAGTFSVFINGNTAPVLNVAMPGSSVFDTSSFYLFKDNSSEDTGGRLDTVAIWSGALSGSQIGSVFTGLAVPPPPSMGAVPEPSTYALAGVAMLGGIIAVRRRKGNGRTAP